LPLVVHVGLESGAAFVESFAHQVGVDLSSHGRALVPEAVSSFKDRHPGVEHQRGGGVQRVSQVMCGRHPALAAAAGGRQAEVAAHRVRASGSEKQEVLTADVGDGWNC
jgi:hypothetical protein